jgi:hypothetical protein
MSTTENITPNYISHRSSLVRTHHLSTPTTNDYHMNRDSLPSNADLTTANAYVSFAKDEKKHLTPYEKLLYDSQYDARFKAEENAGKRIGFYRIYKDIGLGNFSRVKLGVHLLARGKDHFTRRNQRTSPLLF